MKLSTTAALLACAASQAQAFSDSSPFVLFSTANLPAAPSTAQLQTASQVLTTAKSLLASCPTSRYLLVSQPNMHAADLRDPSDSASASCRMPNLCRAVQDTSSKNVWAVAEVIGQVSTGPLAEFVKGACPGASVERVELKHLPPAAGAGGEGRDGERGAVLGDNDYELGKLLESLEGKDYTVMVFSDPNEFQAYEPEFGREPVHVDMKRWAGETEVVGGAKANATDNRSLFEKYQFFTPALFMTFIALLVILSILGVGLKALASLEVSYGAFDKDMGPAAQKKQM